MIDPFRPQVPPQDEATAPSVVFDAYGNQLFPAPAHSLPAATGHHCAVCSCDGGTARRREAARLSPGAAVAVGAGGVLVVGVVLVALLLSVAVVAASVAVAALSLAVVAVVLRSILSRPPQELPPTRCR
ncbi:SpdD protein [Streptomyces sp. UNOB3_S3]|uniref:SpdD protein n=1 Tax=Streptomyces sp. UNOB3_S3 TaxID=2871682 RepID=UPI001E489418|nr:SpdD protein [Streptomyces sp. UNOB3_S3]MCC3775353.1 SpdD protein [Streptomyces sp. UNOB3_S3]